MAADTGFGLTITFNSSFFSAKIRVTGVSGMSREPIDTTHSETTNGDMTYIPSDLIENGEVEIEGIWSNQSTYPPIDQAAESTTITLPDGTTWAGSCFMTNFSWSAPHNDLQTFTATLKISGVWTVT